MDRRQHPAHLSRTVANLLLFVRTCSIRSQICYYLQHSAPPGRSATLPAPSSLPSCNPQVDASPREKSSKQTRVAAAKKNAIQVLAPCMLPQGNDAASHRRRAVKPRHRNDSPRYSLPPPPHRTDWPKRPIHWGQVLQPKKGQKKGSRRHCTTRYV